MQKPVTPDPEIALIANNQKRFLQINEARLKRTLSSLTLRQQSCLLTIPVLLHVNHPLLPGYISQQTPAGIQHFEPSEQQLRIVQNLARSFDAKRTVKNHAILHLSFMGSCGTVAQTKHSDLDFWVCYDPQLSESALQEFKQKLTAIEQWGMSVDLELHFFPMNAEQFKNGERNQASGEDCGSAQHYLLLDEFYRTSVTLAGRFPLWWHVPLEQETNYESYTQHLFQKALITADRVIDFGGIPTIPAGEFIGAGIWQLYKSIDAPYKSVIKILLTEVYASEYPNVLCLSHHFKQAIYQGVTELDALDPYIMLYHTIEAYLLQRQDAERLELLRHCFYFKTQELLSQKPTSHSLQWRRTLIQSLATQWGWDEASLTLLDSHEHWKITQASKENKTLMRVLTQSYRVLSKFAKEHADTLHISDMDMNLLGRKLYAAFEKRAGKIERICPNISNNLLEEYLTLTMVIDSNTTKEVWSIYSGNFPSPQTLANITPIRRSNQLIELLAWCYFNQMIGPHTHFNLHATTEHFNAKKLSGITQHFLTHYPLKTNHEVQNNFHHNAHPHRISWLVNISAISSGENNRYGLSTISDNVDVLSYGSHANNLVSSITEVMMNTWDEAIVRHFDGGQSMVDCIMQLLGNLPFTHEVRLPVIEVLCFSSIRSDAIVRRLQQLAKDLIACFAGRPEGKQQRYVLQIEKTFYVFYFQDNEPRYQAAQNYSNLIKILSASTTQYSPILFDRHTMVDHPLALACVHHTKDLIQIFYHKNTAMLDIYLLDNRCNLVCFSTPQQDIASTLSRLARFIYLVIYRQFKELLVTPNGVPITYHEVVFNKGEKPKVIQKAIRPTASSVKYYEVKVAVESSPTENKDTYTIFCGDQVFSESEHGEQLFKIVAQNISALRQETTTHYPFYITDMIIKKADVPASVAHHVLLKLVIERQLNKALIK